jgi:drug/metabolite transporter (DMT)-like permease
VNQWNLVLYIGMALAVTCQRRVKYGARWWRKQDVPFPTLCMMGFLDAAGSVLSTMGGAYTAGAVQNLLNQVIIPMTLVLSFLFLGQTFTLAQSSGAGIIFVGAAVAVFPSFTGQQGGPNTSSALGIAVFLVSVIPGTWHSPNPHASSPQYP